MTFQKKGMAVDLGGIAKGYACDLAVASLKKNGITRAMVNCGGNIYTFGFSKHNKPWHIGIKHPRKKILLLR